MLMVSCGACPASELLRPQATEAAPYLIVRRLQIAQDTIALIGASGLAPFQRELEVAGTRLSAVPAAAWQDERNASAAIIYVLSGGNKSVAESILGQPQFNESIRPLLKACLAYVNGRTKVAKELLADIDLDNVPPGLRGYLALTRGILASRELIPRARREFSLARLYAPGGVVEQVSLRQQVDLAKHDGVSENAELFLRQLLLRFPHGLHTSDAIETVAGLTSRAGAGRQSEMSSTMESLMSRLSKELQLVVAISFARQAVLRGQITLGAQWALRGKLIAQDGSIQQAQAELYGAAANILSDRSDEATEVLSKIDAARLSSDDATLLRSIMVVNRLVRDPVEALPPLDPAARREPREPLSASVIDPETAKLIKLANASLDQANRLLEANP